jgi:hypothetical protein
LFPLGSILLCGFSCAIPRGIFLLIEELIATTSEQLEKIELYCGYLDYAITG